MRSHCVLLLATAVQLCHIGCGTTADPSTNAALNVTVNIDQQVLVGQKVTARVDASPTAEARYLLQVDQDAKTIWQKENSFTLFFDSAGTHQLVGHARIGQERHESSPRDVVVMPGDFTLEAQQTVVWANAAASVIFYVDVGSTIVSNVEIMDADHNRTYPMHDDGDLSGSGDTVAGDGIFSTIVTETYAEEGIAFQARLSGAPARSQFVNILSVAPPSEESIAQTVEDIATVQQFAEAVALGKRVDEFIEQFPENIDGTTQIRSIGTSDEFILFSFQNGMQHLIEFAEQDTLTETAPLTANPLTSVIRVDTVATNTGNGCVGTNDPIWIKNYKTILYDTEPFTLPVLTNGIGKTIHNRLAADERFTGSIEWLPPEAVTVDAIAETYRLKDFGIVVFSGHGSPTDSEPRETTYNWGEFAFRKIVPGEATESDEHLERVYEALFERLWNTGSTVRWEFHAIGKTIKSGAMT